MSTLKPAHTFIAALSLIAPNWKHQDVLQQVSRSAVMLVDSGILFGDKEDMSDMEKI